MKRPNKEWRKKSGHLRELFTTLGINSSNAEWTDSRSLNQSLITYEQISQTAVDQMIRVMKPTLKYPMTPYQRRQYFQSPKDLNLGQLSSINQCLTKTTASRLEDDQ